MKKIFTPIQVGPMLLKNRMVTAPSVTYNAAPTGEVTQRQVDMYAARARGGFGLVTVEAAMIRDDGCAFPCFLRIDHPRFLPGLSQLVTAIHLYNAKAAIQLIHTGRNAQKQFIDKDPVAPSDKLIWRDKPRVLSTEECEELIGLFAASAGMAKSIGFDAISIHGSLGHLPAQFLSPLTNDRTDKYGDRTRWVVEMIQAVRKAVGPGVAIIYRGSVDEFMEGGLTIEDWQKIAPQLVEAGVDCIDVYPGIFESVIEATLPLYYPEGFYLPFSEKIKQVVDIPVSVVGKLMNPKVAIKAVETGKCDLVSYTRPMFADPEIPIKMMQGRTDDIRRCCGCDHCVGDGFSGRMTECAINASFQREATLKIGTAAARKRVVVAGAGVGGLEAARVCALRGHEVLLFEKEPNVGGLIHDASRMPHLYMRELNYTVEWLLEQSEKHGVKVTTGQAVTPELIGELQPDVVILATGSQPFVPVEIPGIDHPHVMTQERYLKLGGKTGVGKNVVVIGGQFGAELSISLAREGRNVTLVEQEAGNVAAAPYLVKTVTRYIYCNMYLNKDQVNVRSGMKVMEIREKSVLCEDMDGDQEEFAADNVFLCLPREADNYLSGALKERFAQGEAFHTIAAYNSTKLQLGDKTCDLYELGDCVEPRTMKEAIHQATLFCAEI